MKKFSQLAVPYIVWAALMLVMPMFLIAMYSVTEQGNSIVSFKFTLDHYVRFFTDPDFLIILWRSIWIAVKTTIICLLLGYPIAFFIARSSERVQNILVLGITIPMWINMLVRTYWPSERGRTDFPYPRRLRSGPYRASVYTGRGASGYGI